MFCTQCGSQIPDGSTFCPNCGTILNAAQAPAQPQDPQQVPNYQQAPAQPTYQQIPDYQQQSYQQAPAYQNAAPAASKGFDFKGLSFTMPSSISELFCSYNKAGAQYAESTGMQMKWYKALTVVLLYLAAFSNLLAGVQNIFGISYGDSSSYIYSMYPGMRALDLVYGIILIALAVVILYIRMHLAQFKTDGPSLYLMFLLVNVGISIIYSLITNAIAGYSDFSTIGGAIIGGVVMYVLNRTYFGKRQHLFTM